jgi:hypothetical protein
MNHNAGWALQRSMPGRQMGAASADVSREAIRGGPDPGISGDLPGQADDRMNHHHGGASGAVNRWLRPDSVRHMSVTTATQRLTAAHHETRRHNNKKARETGKTQLTGYLCR